MPTNTSGFLHVSVRHQTQIIGLGRQHSRWLPHSRWLSRLPSTVPSFCVYPFQYSVAISKLLLDFSIHPLLSTTQICTFPMMFQNSLYLFLSFHCFHLFSNNISKLLASCSVLSVDIYISPQISPACVSASLPGMLLPELTSLLLAEFLLLVILFI